MFQDKLRYLREHQELSQGEVARRLNIVQTTYSHYECGRREPDFATLKRIANFFNVSIDYLLDNDDAPYASDMMDLEKLVLHGNYTIGMHFPTKKERQLLDEIIKAITDYTQDRK